MDIYSQKLGNKFRNIGGYAAEFAANFASDWLAARERADVRDAAAVFETQDQSLHEYPKRKRLRAIR